MSAVPFDPVIQEKAREHHTTHGLDDEHILEFRRLPAPLILDGQCFEDLWALHPAEPPTIHVRNWKGPAPRWKQAYVRDYTFSGQTSAALPLPTILRPTVQWCRENVDSRLNGALVNWYDASMGHYIGPHSDKTRQLIPSSPIVTVSFGDPRTFRVRPRRGAGFQDFKTDPGLVIVMPWSTNRDWKHEIPKTARPGRRVSLTLRCFA